MAETTKNTEAKKVAPKTTSKSTSTKKATATAEVKVEAPKATAPKAPAKKASAPMLKITLVKSASGRLEKQRRTLEALGLRKIGGSTFKPDNAQTKGMIFVVKHLVSVESVKEN